MAKSNRLDEAYAVLEEAGAFATTTGELFLEAELHRLRGEMSLPRGGAERWFQAALMVARRQGAKSLELRAAMSLFRQRRDGESRAALSEVVAWFTEGFDTLDMRDAKALLAPVGNDSAES